MDLDLSPQLERAIMQSILKYHEGRDNAIPRKTMLARLAQLGFHMEDRQMRMAINLLRKRGNIICSRGGEDGGYYLPADWGELQEFIDHELHPRAMDFLEQERAMKDAARARWGEYSPQMQARMF